MRLRFHIIPYQGQPFDHVYDGGELIIGRSKSAGLIINDRAISRQHARIFTKDGQMFIEDLGSQNGTFLNGIRIHELRPLTKGAIIKFSGNVIYVDSRDSNTHSGAISLGQPRKILRNAAELLDHSSETLTHQGDFNHVRRAERFKLFNEVHNALSVPMDRGLLMEVLLDRIFCYLSPDAAAIFMGTEEDGYDLVASRVLPGVNHSFPYLRSLLREVAHKGMAALVFDAQSDQRFSSSQSIVAAGIHTILAAPLIESSQSLGMIGLVNWTDRLRYTEDDLTLLVSLGSIAGLRLRNLELMEASAAQLRETNRMLEEKVEERTRELLAKTRELEEKNREILETRDHLVMQEKMASLGMLTAGVAHQLRNPLNFIKNFTEVTVELVEELREELIQLGGGSCSEQGETLLRDLENNSRSVLSHGQRTENILNNMLELAKGGASQPVLSDFNNLVGDFAGLCFFGFKARQEIMDITLLQDFDAGIGRIRCVPSAVQRIVANLVNNAIEAVLDRDWTAHEEPIIRLVTRDRWDLVELLIEDNGIGIPAEMLTQVMTPFFTTKHKDRHLGLGLSICYELIGKDHGGTLELQSEPGFRTLVRVTFPKNIKANLLQEG